ncbi:glycosyltransferase [Helicobacter turcicus]|uniref:Glycosyltransferase n=1 Tax=Helicobacter turcicus TaxID=2867412 RepID=A0ABS7JNW7_9HELI|nr:glycosyltransferase [Helicobacter turcicus]MBX7491083.1 glycosyltransferase [Helicobacter turcicus]MBX7545948.1 glycosyltransferase [Helicobacter turcicus]
MQPKKQRVMILLYSLGAGGAERITSLLLEALQKECALKLVLLEDICNYSIPKEIPKVILGNNSTQESGIQKFLKIPFLALKYKKLLKDCDISLSLMTRPNYINILAGLLCGTKKPRILISERSHPSLQYGYGNLNSKINRFLIKMLYNKANKISANSPQNLQDLIQNFRVSPSKTTLLLNFFNLEKIHAQSLEDSALSLQILDQKAQGKFIFISIGRLDSGKNHRLLIDAMQDFKDKASLFIIGGGELESTLKAQILELKLESSVFLLGKTKNPYAPLSCADCFLFASNHEGFPNVLVESLALKIPIISTDCAPREILAPQGKFLDSKSQCQSAKGGILIPLNSKEALCFSMDFILKNPNFFDKAALYAQAQLFSQNTQLLHYKQWILNP